MATHDDDDEVENSKAPLLEHLIELRNRLIYSVVALLIAFGVCYMFAEDIFGFLVEPLAKVLGHDKRLIYTGLTEAFFTYVKVSFYAALFISFPIIASQLYMFVAPGLYRNERKAFMPFLIATPFLFVLGAALAYYFVFPLAWGFFAGFQTTGSETNMAIELEAKVDQYLSLVLALIFAFGLAFQLPVALSLLVRAGLVSAEALAKKRRFAIVIVFLAAAVMTPPDLISQCSLAVPLLVLYEISIFIARRIERARAEREKAEEAELAATLADKDDSGA
ncbi:MAG: twin-arginine translocase subunit TatC [Tistrella sp.]|jgi:sec-independent protein translocase protein TatC|uniref:Sec-independent protein translocase protein TatC n=1 Tax=Tistrella mobilis TaxID=171437 RepID=A0A161Q8K0_9PROT|nr:MULTISPECIES: twin-arginine translocase subunit TatC [Tistrella]KYO57649.1 preprotein translocase subunit TatC [Tistrella mobilis]MAD36643.1 twin-arginine translocase subunit TatC [Tistrella sp.]MBA75750.1 twin-arginine translocase subunit TatC [Tistrella sp.]HAE51044.1 twin-arginine translocase subunit TatC [Tistrella mobilis]